MDQSTALQLAPGNIKSDRMIPNINIDITFLSLSDIDNRHRCRYNNDIFTGKKNDVDMMYITRAA